jgi:hypothetical protein
MNDAEIVAKLIIEAAIPGAVMMFRSDQSHMEYDFELHYPNGEVAAVEVTSSRNQWLTRTNARIFNNKMGGPRINAVLCKKTWLIFPLCNEIQKIREKADEYLAKIEMDGLEKFDILRKHNSPESVRRICDDLNLRYGVVIDSDGIPEIYINGVGSSGAIGPATATKAGEKEAAANKKKLGKAGTNERHLVVHIDPKSNGLACEALRAFQPPLILPNLPQEITHIWLVTEYEKADRFVVWYGSKQEPWRRIDLQVEENPNRAASFASPLMH